MTTPAIELDQTASSIDYGHLPTLIGYRLRKAYGKLFQTFNDMLAELELSPGQYSVLLLISLNPGLTQQALAEATGIDRSTIVPITNRFVKNGWLRRTRRKDDRRAYSLKLTPAGEQIIAAASPIIEAHEQQLVANLDAEERRQLLALLARIV